MRSIYLAGPITGLKYGECVSWREYVKEKLTPKGIQCFSPMRGKDYLNLGEESIQAFYELADQPLSLPRGITTRDRFDVMNCDAIIVNFLGADKVSIGTVMEIAWADMLRKPVVLVMEKNNIHRHPMLQEAVGFVVEDLDSAIAMMEIILNPDVTK